MSMCVGSLYTNTVTYIIYVIIFASEYHIHINDNNIIKAHYYYYY